LVGAAAALSDADWFFGEGDELAVAVWRGVPLERVMAHLLGLARSPLDDRARHLVASGWKNAAHLTHAVGFAGASRVQPAAEAGSAYGVVLASFRATMMAAGEFHNALNFAGVFRAPVVFLCRSDAAVSDAPAVERAVAYGIRAASCDAADVHDVVAAVRVAVE